ncbi:hypothetical protein CVT24_004382 [Panaeolus cyanescens]|uniref:GSKIP domain-containing protein n=1 Tax=Panaeolus cyanescens TaxID=181874 RepID=A0A409VC88_9AGAR|nr:hypothetical protein CVT24_004382 [Panaeolus cyanescens]
MSTNSSSSSFYHAELLRALREQAFGITSFSMTSSSPEQASASVVLLEGRSVNIKLTIQGYSVMGPCSGASGTGVHESIETLLRAISPLYQKRQHEALFAKLAKVS